MAEERSEVILEVKTEGERNVTSLRQQLRQYNNQLGSLERGTEEYNKVLAEYSRLASQQYKITRDQAAATLNTTQTFQQASSAVAGLVGGFNAFNSVLALTGVENEKLAETFVKLQAGMSLAQGITQLSTGYKSLITLLPRLRSLLIGLNATLAANPVLAVATGVVALTAVVTTLITVLRRNNDSVKELTKSYEDLESARVKSNSALEYEIKLLQAQGATELDIVNERLRANQEDIINLENFLRERYSRLQNASNREKKLIREQIKDTQKTLLEARELSLSLAEESVIIAARNQYKADQAEIAEQKKKAKEKKNAAEREYKEALKQQQDFLNLLQSQSESYIDSFLLNQSRIRASLSESINIAKLQLNELIDEFSNEESIRVPLLETFDEWASQESIQNRSDAYEEEIRNLYQLAEDTSISLEIRRNAFREAQEIQERYQAFQVQAGQQTRNILQQEQRIRQSAFSSTVSILNSTSQLLGQQTAAGKAAAVTGATIDTYRAATGAYAALAGIPIVGPALGIAAAAAAIASGAANVKAILSANSSGNISAPISTSTTSSNIPNINSNMYEPINNEFTRRLQSQEDRNINDTRVYIYEDDINDSRDRVKIRQNESSS